MYDVACIKCPDYSIENIRPALSEAIDAVGGLNAVKPGMTVGIKVNLVAGAKPEKAVTTHPALVAELCAMLRQKGARVIIGDSPGGLYSSLYVNRIYSASGMKALEGEGVSLNQDFSEKETLCKNAETLKEFKYTAWLDKCDVLINFCKLKTHGMMSMSCGAKNFFGAVPGTVKPEYHFKYPDYDKFASVIVDIVEHFKPTLTIVDAIDGMEGNGPTMGTPRHIGAIIASASPHKADLVGAQIIGLGVKDAPTLACAVRRGLCPALVEELKVYGDISSLKIPDYKLVEQRKSIVFSNKEGFWGRFVYKFMESALRSRPHLKSEECVGCGVCRDICPAKAITIRDKRAVIDRSSCICCFCCQEFCPKGALKVKRPLIAKLLDKRNDKNG